MHVMYRFLNETAHKTLLQYLCLICETLQLKCQFLHHLTIVCLAPEILSFEPERYE